MVYLWDKSTCGSTNRFISVAGVHRGIFYELFLLVSPQPDGLQKHRGHHKHLRVRAEDRALKWFSWLGVFFMELCLVLGMSGAIHHIRQGGAGSGTVDV